MSDKKPKVFSPKRHVRIDKMGGVVGECLRDEVAILVDEWNYTGTKLLELGIQTAAAKHGLLGHLKTVAKVETVVSEAA